MRRATAAAGSAALASASSDLIPGSLPSSLEEERGFGQFDGDVDPGAMLDLETVRQAAILVAPRLDREVVPPDPVRCHRGTPAIVGDVRELRGLALALVGRPPQDLRPQQIVTIGKDVGLDHQRLADDVLGREDTAVHRGGYTLDDDGRLCGRDVYLSLAGLLAVLHGRSWRHIDHADFSRFQGGARIGLHGAQGSPGRRRKDREIERQRAGAANIVVDGDSHASARAACVRTIRPQQYRDGLHGAGERSQAAGNPLAGHLLDQHGRLLQSLAVARSRRHEETVRGRGRQHQGSARPGRRRGLGVKR